PQCEPTGRAVTIYPPAVVTGLYVFGWSAPSEARQARSLAATSSPTEIPPAFPGPSVIFARESAYAASRAAFCSGKSFTRVVWAAATPAASEELPDGAFTLNL